MSASVGTSFSITSSVTSYDNTITVIGSSPDPGPVPSSINVVKGDVSVIPSALHGYEIVGKDKGPITDSNNNGQTEAIISITEPMEIAVYYEIEVEPPIFISVQYGFQLLEARWPTGPGYLRDVETDATIITVNPDEFTELSVTIATLGGVRIFFEIQP